MPSFIEKSQDNPPYLQTNTTAICPHPLGLFELFSDMAGLTWVSSSFDFFNVSSIHVILIFTHNCCFNWKPTTIFFKNRSLLPLLQKEKQNWRRQFFKNHSNHRVDFADILSSSVGDYSQCCSIFSEKNQGQSRKGNLDPQMLKRYR